MKYISRHTALAGAGAAALATSGLLGTRAVAAVLEAQGCCLRADQRAVVESRLVGAVRQSRGFILSSGNQDLDAYLGRALLRLSDDFGVDPGFAFLPDGIAHATSETYLPGTRGTVVFGLPFFYECLSDIRDNGLTVITICAHEFGHIVQYATRYYEQLRPGQGPVKLLELHADYLAGFYLAGRKREHPDLELQYVGRTFELFGDNDFTSIRHHGTSQERVAAIEAGFYFGKSGRGAITQAAEAGAQFVRRRFS